MKAKPYPKYKPSGVEWLGEVPEHWGVKAIKWETPVLRGASPRPIDDPIYFDDDAGEYAWVRISDVTSAGAYLTTTEQKLSTLGSSLSVKLNPGSLFLSIAGTIGKPCITRIKCCIHDGFVYFPRFKGDSKFLYYLFASGEPYRGLGKLGTQLNLNTDAVGSIIAGFPSYSEQRSIANFLDRETARIDTLVAKKRELIERLKEKRSALISQTVTRGLPPEAAAKAGLPVNPRLKPSGVEWLGDVPEHWEATKLRHFISILSGFAFPSSGFTRDEFDMRLLRGINVSVSRVRWDDTVYWHRAPGDDLGRFVLNEGTLVIGMDRPWVSEGVRVAILSGSDVPCLLLQRVAAIRPTKLLFRDYLFRILSSPMFPNYFTPEMTGVSVPHISPDQIGDFPIPVPPRNEQIAIAEHLDVATAKLDLLVAKVEEAIDRLQEHRTALITAAVTGKIDVRKDDAA